MPVLSAETIRRGLIAAMGLTSAVLMVAALAGTDETKETETATTAEAPAAESAKPYGEVRCEKGAEGATVCHVEKAVYIGWRTFHGFCHVCHAQDAVGSTFAPSLVEHMKTISKERFMNSVANGYKGQVGVMPPWKDNPNVRKRYQELYAYLMARADGVLKRGRPKRFKKK